MRPTGPLEKDVEQRVKGLYEKAGCWVESRSQGYRPGGKGHGTTRQTEGLPDLMVWPPRGLPWFHETKRQGGTQSVAQQDYEERSERHGLRYVLGGPHEALQELVARGLWKLPLGLTVERVAGPATAVTKERRK